MYVLLTQLSKMCKLEINEKSINMAILSILAYDYNGLGVFLKKVCKKHYISIVL